MVATVGAVGAGAVPKPNPVLPLPAPNENPPVAGWVVAGLAAPNEKPPGAAPVGATVESNGLHPERYLILGRKKMFYLTTHSTHFYLRLYGVRHMVKEGRKCFI